MHLGGTKVPAFIMQSDHKTILEEGNIVTKRHAFQGKSPWPTERG